MKSFAALMILLGFSSASFADEPAFCKSVCSSEKTTCRADAQARQQKEGLLPTNVPEKNPFARTAQIQMRSDDGGALEQAGDTHRRMTQAGVCEKDYQRCTQACTKTAG
jgi:hypothetical protein